MTRYVTDSNGGANTDPIASEAGMEERYRLYRLCPCDGCGGTGKFASIRCTRCRGESRTLELVATCGTPEAVGVALVTLSLESEWDECPFGLMDRPEGQTGKWLIKPWGPSARNISDAARTLATARHRDSIQVISKEGER